MAGELSMLCIRSKEQQIKKEITDYLNTLGGKLIRLNSAGTIIRGIRVKQAYLGVPDLLLLLNGKAYFIEVKTKSEHQFIKKHYNRLKEGGFNQDNIKLDRYQKQILFLEDVVRTGNVGLFASSVEDFIHLLN